MTLIGAILKKVTSKEVMKETRKYTSPPPEIDESMLRKKRKTRKHRYSHIRSIVDSSSPAFDGHRMFRNLPSWQRHTQDIYLDNIRMLIGIITAYMRGGKVDSHWTINLASLKEHYYENRVHRYRMIKRENKEIYKRIQRTRPRVVPTTELNKEWAKNKRDIVHMTRKKFVLFPVNQQDVMEDPAFAAPGDVLRPKVYITLKIRGGSTLATLAAELFTDVCPDTCKLFLELIDGDGVGFGYVGTQFFRKVPNLYWSGGDVVYNNGFGCYAQRGRVRPIAAENYHFSHSMPGLLSMRVSSEGDVCGIFNITFKSLPQFDLRNVVFGRMAPKKYYTPEQMGDAIEAVRKGEKVATAAQRFGVPRITLYNKISGKSPVVCSMGPQTVLSKSEEEILEKWLLAMSSRHFPINRELLMDSVQKIVTEQGKPNPFTNNKPGVKWFKSFMKRHPDITEKTSQNLTKSRDDVTEADIRRWFDEIQLYLEERGLKDILKEPKRIFNTDESAFFLSPKAGRVLCKRGDKHLYTFCGDEKDNLTVLITANAAGQLAPPMIVFKYERVPSHISATIPDHWGIGKSESGWMCGSTFYEFVTNILNPWIEQQGIEKPILFFLDGHKSHLTLHLSKFCSENGIEVIALYPNSTHILQPMDLAVFRPLKVAWRKEVTRWQQDHLGDTLKKQHFAPVLENAISSITEDCIRNGFKAGGLHPFGADYIDMTKITRRQVNIDNIVDPKQIEFYKYLESEIVNVYSREKLELFNKLYYKDRTTLEQILPNEDESLYVIWAKNKQTASANNASDVNQEHQNTDHSVSDQTQNSEHSIATSSSAEITDLANHRVTPSMNAKAATDLHQEEYRTEQTIPVTLHTERSVCGQTEDCEHLFATSSYSTVANITNPTNYHATPLINTKAATDIIEREEYQTEQTIPVTLHTVRPLCGQTEDSEHLLAIKLAPIEGTTGHVDNDRTNLTDSTHSELPLTDQSKVGYLHASQPESNTLTFSPKTLGTNSCDSFTNLNVVHNASITSINNANFAANVNPEESRAQQTLPGNDLDQTQIFENLLDSQPALDILPSCSTTQTKTPQKQTLEAALGLVIPSPFKRNLFWPEEIKERKRTKREKIPYAVTSKAWQEYHKKKEAEKLKLQEEKEKRAKERLEKKLLKEKNMEIKKKIAKNKKKVVNNEDTTSESEDTDLEVTYAESDNSDYIENDGDEDENTDTVTLPKRRRHFSSKDNSGQLKKTRKNKSKALPKHSGSEAETSSSLAGIRKSSPRVGQFVIVKYEGEYFPGKTENVDKGQYEISTMVLSTGNSFRWPDKPDKIWYRTQDLVEVIGDPLPLNKRGFFKIKEMEKYLPNVYDI